MRQSTHCCKSVDSFIGILAEKDLPWYSIDHMTNLLWLMFLKFDDALTQPKFQRQAGQLLS